MKKKVVILGGGLAGLYTALCLQENDWIEEITIIEKEDDVGGLCRSISHDGYVYDVGPHIIFSKDRSALDSLLGVLNGKHNKIRRSNEIFYEGRLIQYPFENDLSKLPIQDLKYCIDTFNDNPYETYDASNMLQFFLKTFGEGITNIYLRPYNEKIWKFDPSFMNTDMVERIPKPTQEEIRRSAQGETIDGYLHQLYFYYPKTGGINSVIHGIKNKLLMGKVKIITKESINSVISQGMHHIIRCNSGDTMDADVLISTIPVPGLIEVYQGTTPEVEAAGRRLRYNSILIAFVRVHYDNYGDHFTYTIPSKDIIFHRISKMDYLGDEYHRNGEATYIVEITYKPGQRAILGTEEDIIEKIKKGMVDINAALKKEDVDIINITDHEYAYVVYDLDHKLNMNTIRRFFSENSIYLHGRFGNFEYWNMDRIVLETNKMAEKISQ